MNKSPVAAIGLLLIGIAGIGWVGVQAWHYQSSLALKRFEIIQKAQLEQTKREEQQRQLLEQQQRAIDIRRECVAKANQIAAQAHQDWLQRVNEFSMSEWGQPAIPITPSNQNLSSKEDYEFYYQQCMRVAGIE